ncbi:MAG: hypothetical protein QM758_22405 [Armatimonas sp.]
MKRALPLLIALALPLMAFADDPASPVAPRDPGEPTSPAKTGEPVGYTVIPLEKVKVISVEQMVKNGGLISAENFPDANQKKSKKKKKKKRPAVPMGVGIAAGVFGIAASGQSLRGRRQHHTHAISQSRCPCPGATGQHSDPC